MSMCLLSIYKWLLGSPPLDHHGDSVFLAAFVETCRQAWWKPAGQQYGCMSKSMGVPFYDVSGVSPNLVFFHHGNPLNNHMRASVKWKQRNESPKLWWSLKQNKAVEIV